MRPSEERWVEVDALFAAALDQPPDSRRSFVETASGDPEIVARVLDLLESLGAAERLIGESAERFVTPSGPLGLLEDEPLGPGTRLGAYVLEDELGQGGMGRVYRASRAEADFERQVAIKVVRSSGSGETVTRSFLAERRILAGLEHPNIARLYDSGLAPDGRPYLVMELVTGQRIDRYAAERQLGLEARLGLFDAVLDAVAFAHRRLVVHRDLKPGNILVSDTGRVTLLDFGIARLLSDDLAEATRPGHRMLTPEYASPEQVRGDPSTAVMDVYALGVVLHELVVGTRPGWQNMVASLRPVAEVEAAMAPPSSRAPVPIARQLRGDVDTILLTALAPEPTRRYPSVESLRDDLNRYRRGLPILARPATPGYRARKFVRRNPVGVVTAVGMLLLVAGFLGSTLVQSRRVMAERDRAELERARAAQIVKLLTGLFESADPLEEGRPDTIRVASFLATGVERVERDLAGQPAVLAEVLAVLGGIQRNMGRHPEAAQLLERSVALRREMSGTNGTELAWSLNALGLNHLAQTRLAEAESLYREARTLYQAAGKAGQSGLRESLANLAQVFMEQGRLDSAAILFDSVLVLFRHDPGDSISLSMVLSNRALTARRLGDGAGALGFIQQAYEVSRQALGPEHPTTLRNLGAIGLNLDRNGRSTEAVPLLREAVAGLRRRLGPEHPALVSNLANLSHALGGAGLTEEAVRAMEEAVGIARRHPDRRMDLAFALDHLAAAYHRVGRMAEAEAAEQSHYEMLRDVLGPSHRETGRALASLAFLRCRQGAAVERRRRAIREFETALRVLDSTMQETHPMRVIRHAWYGSCLASLGETARAEAELERQFDLAWRNHPPEAPAVSITTEQLLRFHERTGNRAGRARVQALKDSLGIKDPT